MAKNGVRLVEKALEKGFAAKGAKVSLLAEKSDYKDFVRVFVVSDYFRRRTEKERLGEIFEMLEENGAENQVAKISLCIAMTPREYEREFGDGDWLQGVSPSVKRKSRAGVHNTRL